MSYLLGSAPIPAEKQDFFVLESFFLIHHTYIIATKFSLDMPYLRC